MERIVLPGNTPILKEGSRWVLGNMQFSLPLSSIAALNEMWAAAAILRDRPDVCRHKVKRDLNAAIKCGDRHKTLLMHYLRDRDVMDEFTDHIVDVTAEDVKALRDCIREKMTANGVEEADLVAWTETTRQLLILAVQHFNMVMIHAWEKFQHDYTPYVRQLRMDAVRDAWHMVVNAIDPHPELTTEADVLEKLKVVSANYANGKYLRECIALMKDHPYFKGIQVDVEGFDNEKV